MIDSALIFLTSAIDKARSFSVFFMIFGYGIWIDFSCLGMATYQKYDAAHDETLEKVKQFNF